MLRGIDEHVLKIISQKLIKPVRYTDNSFIMKKGEPLKKMVYIVDGFVSIEERSSDDSRRGAGQLCGEELLRWPFYSYFPVPRPRATESVKAIGVVEALALNAWDLRNMPTFRYMDDEVLKEICSHLQPMKYNRTDNIIDKDDPIQMLFIVEGRIGQEGWVKDAGEIYGEELLVWPFSTFFPDRVPTVAESPFIITDVVEALVLTASDMESVATKFRKHFIKNYGILIHNLRFSTRSVHYYTEKEIQKATSNYTCLNYPNEGGYGTVYHMKLDGTAVAIKTCNSATGDPFIQSQRLVHEAFVLLHISHKNVVRLLGCCLETRWPIMVYDRTNALTPVEHFHKNRSKLSLESRAKIAAETAGALAHMHSRSVIHRDVKTTNILVDRTTHTVQVTGFGASRLLDEGEGEMEDKVSTLPGTSRHLDPEYLKSHDVYSFGVVLVELLTHQEAVSSNGSETSLANDFVRSVQEDRLGQILDGEINTDKFSFEMARKVSELAVTCLRSREEERPSMEKVAEELEGVVQTIRNRVEHSTVDDNVSSVLELPSEVLM